MTAQMVTPCSATARRHCMSSSAVEASRPEVGSSRKSSDGSATSSIPMLTRFFCPPEMPRREAPPQMACLCSERESSPITRSTHVSTACADIERGSRSAAANQSCSLTVRHSTIVSSCGTKPCSLVRDSAEQGDPPRVCVSLPALGLSFAESTLISVVFPQPEGPMRAVTVPCTSWPVTSLTTGVPLGRR